MRFSDFSFLKFPHIFPTSASLLNMKLMLQMVYTEAAAQISTLPDCVGRNACVPTTALVLYTASALFIQVLTAKRYCKFNNHIKAFFL